jgi:glycosyltransferase involved in cell wall biosynthesis
MQKIVIVTDAWHPQVNGVVTVIENIRSILEKRGCTVVIIHPGLFSSIPLFFYPEIRLSLFAKRKVARLIEAEKPDHIHLDTEGPLGLAARGYCIRTGKKFTTAYHTHFALYAKLRFGAFFNLVYPYIRWFHSRAEYTMVTTETLRQDLKARGLKNLVIRPLGTDTALFKRNPGAVMPDRLRKPVFMYFGRIAKEKGVEDFLKCKLPGSKLVFGDGSQRTELETKYGETALFVGYKKGQALVDMLSVSDVFVFPSRTETFGLVILEALACGIPVAAYNVMGPNDIVTDGVDGLLGEDLQANAIKCLKLLPEDCRRKAVKFSWEASTDAFFQNLVRADE